MYFLMQSNDHHVYFATKIYLLKHVIVTKKNYTNILFDYYLKKKVFLYYFKNYFYNIIK